MMFNAGCIAIFLGASLTAAERHVKKGILYNQEPDEPVPLDLRELEVASGSEADSPVPSQCIDSFNIGVGGPGGLGGPGTRPTGYPDPNFNFFSFCSGYLQPTATITQTHAYTSFVTVTVTTAVQVTTTTYATATATGTAAAYCPIPIANMTCGINAWGVVANNLYSNSPIDPFACHQLCLTNPKCNSFQIDSSNSTHCLLYSTNSSGNNTIASPSAPYLFYDRDCSDYIPAGCSSAVTIPSITRKPTATAVARDVVGTSVPWFLAGYGTSSLSDICSCIITSPSPTATLTSFATRPTLASVSVTRTTTDLTLTITSNVGAQTSYSSIY